MICDNLWEMEIDISYNILEISLVTRQLMIFALLKATNFFLIHILPEKIVEYCQLIVGIGTMTQFLRAI